MPEQVKTITAARVAAQLPCAMALSDDLKRLDWDRLRVFHTVAVAGSLSRAGVILGLSQSAVSRQVSNLEADLEMDLFLRHARGLLLTERGEILFEAVGDIIDRLTSAENRLNDMRRTPSGELTVSLSVGLGSMWLADHLTDFIKDYPDMRLRLLLAEEEPDLSAREAHISIRFKRPTRVNLVQKHLVSVAAHAYASTDYIAECGRPESKSDLNNHRLIAYTEESVAPFPNMNWPLRAGLPNGRTRRARMSVNNVPAMVRATAAGMGVAALPDFFAELEPNLKMVLHDEDQVVGDLYLVYSEDLRQSRRVRVFVDYVTELARSLAPQKSLVRL